jgi:N-acetylmuramoyl-L-alanine amidase
MIAKPYTELSEVDLLALCEWREADDQGIDGMRGVGHVVMNRVQHPSWWGTNLHEVILKPWQFSSFNHGDPNETRWPEDDNVQWIEGLAIADAVLSGRDTDLTEGAANYYDVSIDPPDWAAQLVFTAQIGKLRFYRLPELKSKGEK